MSSKLDLQAGALAFRHVPGVINSREWSFLLSKRAVLQWASLRSAGVTVTSSF